MTKYSFQCHLEGVVLAPRHDPTSFRLQQVDWPLVGVGRGQQRHVDDVIPCPQVM